MIIWSCTDTIEQSCLSFSIRLFSIEDLFRDIQYRAQVIPCLREVLIIKEIVAK